MLAANSSRFPRLLIAFLVSVFLLAIGIYSAWSASEQRSASERKVLEEARILSQQMEATWNYVDSVQDSINYNKDGRYDFKGVYCSVAGKSIAANLNRDTDLVVRYTRHDPRTGPDAPDAFEAAALDAFERGGTEYYAVTTYEGRTVLRYLSVIPVRPGCLSCHGSPVGELDETGFPKEGYELGDVAGAVSLVIPMEQYEEEAAQRTAANVALFVVLTAVIVVCAGAVNLVLSRQREEVERANEQLAKANEDLRRESEYKSTFLATMSHELRTPLASSIALADAWGKIADSPTDQERELVGEIRRSSTGLLELVNNTLDAASLEAGRYEVTLAPLDVLDAAGSVERTVAPLARSKGVGFAVEIQEGLPLVLTDPSIVHKVLMNLLSNAVKFTDAGGSVRLSVGFDRGDSALVVVVADTGIGISDEDLPRVFERFRQADSSISRRYGGSGLGLSLVKEMSELLGGSVSVESRVGGGSEFAVRIPCAVIEEEGML